MQLYRNDLRVPIGRKTVDTLLLLIENKDHIVTRETLHRYIWASDRISASTIPMCITEIRKALGDDARSPRFVASSKGRGYQFVGEVTLHTDAESIAAPHLEFPFVGRKAILAALQETVRKTRIDLQGRTISILGEAGVGKSRLLTEFLGHSAQNFDFIIARGNPTHPNTAYSIWTNALRQLLEKYPDSTQLLQNARQIGSVLPEIRVDGQTFDPSPQLDRQMFFLHWSNAFRSIARQRPLLIALEDFHFADDDSIALFEHLSVDLASSPILFVVLARPTLQTRRIGMAAKSIQRSVHQTPIHLMPFTLKEVESFIDPFAENRDSLVREIFKQTAGNAFYITHLLRTSRGPASSSTQHSWMHLAMPDASEIVSKQLSDLPAATRSALQMASVLGQAFVPLIVASALEITVPELLEDLVPALSASVIQPDGPDFIFCHAILRDSLYHSLTPRSRMELHERIVRTIQKAPPPANISSSILFSHTSQAYPLVSAREIRTAALRAGTDAMSRLAFQDALRIFDSSLEILKNEPIVDTSTHFEILINRASSMYYSGNRDGAKESLLEAAAWSREINSPTLLARCGLAMAPDFLSIEVGAYDSDQDMLLREALGGLAQTEHALRSRVIARLSQISKWKWSHADEPSLLASEALALATKSGDSDALIAALSAGADAAHGPDRTDERIRYILALQEATVARCDTYHFLLQQTRLIAALLEKGEIRRLSAENERYRQIAEKIGLPQYRWYPVSTDSMLMCLAGNLDEAERLADHYKEIAGTAPDQNLVQTYACQSVLRGIDRDRSDKVISLVERFANEKKTVLSWAAGLVWLQWDTGKHDAARESLRQFSEADVERLFREPGGMIGIASLAEACAYLGERRQARFLFDLIAPVWSKFATAGYGVAYFGTMARYASLLAISLREYGTARKLASLAVTQEQSTGSCSWLTYAILDRVRADQRSLEIKNAATNFSTEHISQLLRLGLARAHRLTIETGGR